MTDSLEPSVTPDVPFALPDITEREIAEVVDTLRSSWLTTGPKTRQFEENFAAAVGGRYAVALNSCTAALHLSLEALGVRAGDRVYMSPYTFAATAEVVRYLGATPVFVDIDPETLNIDLGLLEDKLASDAANFPGEGKAIIPVHIAGVPVDMERVWELARQYNLAVVEDAAHAFPAERDGRVTGAMPEDVRGSVCFSFYATKTITTGEGGMLVTQDEVLANRARSMSLHGLSRAAWGRYEKGGSWRYDIVAPGFKYNLSDIASSLGLVQLSRAHQMRDRRAAIAERYQDALTKGAALQLPTVPAGVISAWHLFVLRLADEEARDSLVDHLSHMGIGTSVHFIPLHLHSYYRETYGYKPGDFPVATREFSRAVSLPLFSSMTDDQIQRVIEAVQSWGTPRPVPERLEPGVDLS